MNLLRLFKATLLLGLILSFSNLRAEVIDNISYVSFENFGLPALEISTLEDQDTIEIFIQPATLSYPDSGFNFEQREKLENFFALKDLNSLLLSIPKTGCQMKNIQLPQSAQLLTCNRAPNLEKVLVRGAITQFDGTIEEVSQKSLITSRLDLRLSRITRETTYRTEEFLQVQINGILDLSNEDMHINLVKSHIHPR